jgi:hypothetical protein
MSTRRSHEADRITGTHKCGSAAVEGGILGGTVRLALARWRILSRRCPVSWVGAWPWLVGLVDEEVAGPGRALEFRPGGLRLDDARNGRGGVVECIERGDQERRPLVAGFARGIRRCYRLPWRCG